MRAASPAQDGSTQQQNVAHDNVTHRPQLKVAVSPNTRVIICKRYKGFELAHKCPVCGGQHSYNRNNGMTGQSTRLMDRKAGYKRMSKEEKERMLEEVRGCKQSTSWKHTAVLCRQRYLQSSSSKTKN